MPSFFKKDSQFRNLRSELKRANAPSEKESPSAKSVFEAKTFNFHDNQAGPPQMDGNLTHINYPKKLASQLSDPGTWIKNESMKEKENDYPSIDYHKVVRFFYTQNKTPIVVRLLEEPDSEITTPHLGLRMAQLRKIGIPFEEPIANFTLTQHNGIYSIEDRHYFVSRQVEGKPLNEIARLLKPEEKLNVYSKIIDLLKKLHEQGFAHGHPHLHNIVYNANGGQITFIDPKRIIELPEKFKKIPTSLELVNGELDPRTKDLHYLLQRSKSCEILSDDQCKQLLGRYLHGPGKKANDKEWKRVELTV